MAPESRAEPAALLRQWKAFLRDEGCVVGRYGEPGRGKPCLGIVECAHLKHDGMGGSKSNPVIGNSVGLCTQHHTDMHGHGWTWVDETYKIERRILADALAQRFAGPFVEE